jgi:peptide/nickel transport system substrate-binding protein
MSRDHNRRETDDVRRQFLKAIGLGGLVGVAGCTGNQEGSGTQTTESGDGGGGGGDDTTEDTSTEADTESESSGGGSAEMTFIKGKNQPLTHLDAHAINDGTMIELGTVYDTLLDYAKGDPTQINPMLATDWESVDGGSQWVLTLREGVEFNDGTPFDGYAAMRSLQRSKNLTAGQSKPYGWIESINDSGDYEVTINAQGSYGPAPAQLTFVTTSMINPTVIDEHEDEENIGHEYFKNNIHGTGAFDFESWEKGSAFVATLDEDNWRFDLGDDAPANLVIPEEANVTTFRGEIVREQLTQKQRVAQGDIDVSRDINWTNTQEVVNNNENVVLYDAGPDLYAKYVFMMCQREPTSDVNFRKALAYAADYQGIAEELIGIGVPWGVPWPEGIWPRVTEGQYRQDLERAQEFLDQSSYDGRELTFRSIQGSENDKIGSALVANFEQIGVNMNHEDIPWSNLYEQLTSAETMPDLLMYSGWPDVADPDGPAVRYWGDYHPPDGWNTAYYSNPDYDEMYVEARDSGDREKRAELYRQMQEMLIEDVPIIWLYQETHKRAVNANIPNYSYTPGEFNYVAAHQFTKNG